MPDTKSMTLRLDQELADKLEAVAEVQDRAIAEVVRSAIREHIERCQQDPEFQEMLRRNLERHERLLQMLAET